MSFASLTLPVASIHPDNVSYFQEAADLNAAAGFTEYPLFAVELDNFMFAGGDSETCLRRCTTLLFGFSQFLHFVHIFALLQFYIFVHISRNLALLCIFGTYML